MIVSGRDQLRLLWTIRPCRLWQAKICSKLLDLVIIVPGGFIVCVVFWLVRRYHRLGVCGMWRKTTGDFQRYADRFNTGRGRQFAHLRLQGGMDDRGTEIACRDCGAVFPRRIDMYKHGEEVHRIIYYQCPFCAFKSENRRDICGEHVRARHPGRHCSIDDVLCSTASGASRVVRTRSPEFKTPDAGRKITLPRKVERPSKGTDGEGGHPPDESKAEDVASMDKSEPPEVVVRDAKVAKYEAFGTDSSSDSENDLGPEPDVSVEVADDGVSSGASGLGAPGVLSELNKVEIRFVDGTVVVHSSSSWLLKEKFMGKEPKITSQTITAPVIAPDVPNKTELAKMGSGLDYHRLIAKGKKK